MELCASRDFAGLAELETHERLGAKFFGSAPFLALLKRILLNEPYKGEIPTPAERATFSLLARLPIPKIFYGSIRIQEVLRDIQRTAIAEADRDAIAVWRKLGPVGLAFDDPVSYQAGIIGAGRVLRAGDEELFGKYEEAFRLNVESMRPEDVEYACCKLLEVGMIDETIAFARHFPQFGNDILDSGNIFPAAKTCAERIVESGTIDGIDRVVEFAGLRGDDLETLLGGCVRIIIENGNADLLAQLRERWNGLDGEIVFRARTTIATIFEANHVGERVRGAWDRAHAIARMADCPPDRFRELAFDGLVGGDRAVQNWDNPHGGKDGLLMRVLQIHEMRQFLPVDAAFADRLERGAVAAILTNLLGQDKFDLVNELAKIFPATTDKDAIRQAAIACTKQLGMPTSRWNVGRTNDWLKTRGIAPLGWDDIHLIARSNVLLSLRRGNPAEFLFLAHALEMSAGERSLAVASLRKEAEQSMFSNPSLTANHHAQMFDLYGFSWKTFPLAFVPPSMLIEPTDPDLRARAEQDPWREALVSLLKLQARSSNQEHDPWRKEFDPLVRLSVHVEDLHPNIRLSGDFSGTLDRNSAKDGALLVEYVKTFGMFNLPNASRVYFRLKKGPFASLPEDDQRMLVELAGTKAERMGSENLINEMRKLRFSLQTELLADRIPLKIATTVGAEIFSTLRGSTQWDRGNDVSATVEAWKNAIARTRADIVETEQDAVRALAAQLENEAAEMYAAADGLREKIAVAPGYEETTFPVARMSRRSGGTESAEREVAELFTGESSDVIGEAIDDYLGQMLPVLNALEKVSWYWVTKLWVAKFTWLDRNGWTGEELATLSAEEFERKIAGQLERTAAVEPQGSQTRRCLQLLSAMHLRRVAPDAWITALRNAYSANSLQKTVEAVAEFQTQYLKEHYLHPTQAQEHTGHTPFSEPLRQALERAWNAEGDENTNVILRTNARIKSIRARLNEVSKGQVDVTLVPVQGLLRVYAGDVGDACYTSKHAELANGKFQGLKALIFVTNRGKPSERMAGSVLLIETTVADTGEQVLLIRANNPRQNLIASVDAASLVRSTIDATIEIARRRKIKRVAVVLDGAGGASSNRREVSDYLAEQFWKMIPVPLANQPETNFNNYPVWNANGGHPSVIVWTNEDPEAT